MRSRGHREILEMNIAKYLGSRRDSKTMEAVGIHVDCYESPEAALETVSKCLRKFGEDLTTAVRREQLAQVFERRSNRKYDIGVLEVEFESVFVGGVGIGVRTMPRGRREISTIEDYDGKGKTVAHL